MLKAIANAPCAECFARASAARQIGWRLSVSAEMHVTAG